MCPQFESGRSHQFDFAGFPLLKSNGYAGLAQLFRARPCQGRGQGLESPDPHHEVHVQTPGRTIGLGFCCSNSCAAAAPEVRHEVVSTDPPGAVRSWAQGSLQVIVHLADHEHFVDEEPEGLTERSHQRVVVAKLKSLEVGLVTPAPLLAGHLAVGPSRIGEQLQCPIEVGEHLLDGDPAFSTLAG